MPPESKPTYDFGPFCLDLGERALRRDGKPIALTPKAFEILAFLVQNPGHSLAKEEMIRQVWPGTFVDESNLSQHVFQLRKILGDAPDGRAYIETVPRHGYRFTQDVKRIDATPAGNEAAAAQAAPPAFSGATGARAQPRRIIALTLAAALAVAAVIFFARNRIWTPARPETGKVMLAVLPFENLSGDPQQEYISEGLTEEMITQLGSLEPSRLGIIARTSAMQYKDAHKDTRQIARELGVDYILEGSVRREGDRVRITAQLIQVKDDTHVWAKNYDRNLRDILTLESDVAGAVAKEVQLRLTPAESARLANPPATDPRVYELYLKGRYFWNKRTMDAYAKAIDSFQRAIAADPGYAPAYAGLADAYALLGSSWNPSIPRSQAMPKAKEAALKALQLDDSLAEAHTSLAFVKMHFDWDWPGSESEYHRALELNPNYATAHEWYAFWFASQGKIGEALEQLAFAQKADPLSLIIMADTSEILGYARRFDSSKAQAERALELDPNFAPAYMCLADSHVGTRDYQMAVSDLQKALALNAGNTWALTKLGVVYALAGDRNKSEAILQNILNVAKNRDDVAIDAAQMFSVLGEKDQAFAWLEKAFAYREGALILLNARMEFEPLHADPRYSDFVRRLGILPVEKARQ
ncbi:MAG TPA: winged helix-turn-helix domain-containing protein [Candidatus Acidoferrales bacterium]|nr:winged helix-turn-helix domain-containing protein [Candidatus Acidoferrales bacterium]